MILTYIKPMFYFYNVQDLGPKLHFSEAVVRRCYVKKMLQKISQNLQENTFTRVFWLLHEVDTNNSSMILC